MNELEHINQAIDITDILNQYGEPNKHTGRYKCPIHGGNNYNLKVYPKTNSFNCFKCGASGTVIDFIKFFHNIDYKSAIKFLDSQYNLGLFEELTHQEKHKYKEELQKREQYNRICKLNEYNHEKLKCLLWCTSQAYNSEQLLEFYLEYIEKYHFLNDIERLKMHGGYYNYDKIYKQLCRICEPVSNFINWDFAKSEPIWIF